MSEDRSPSSFSPVRWVAIPVLITLAVTVLRVFGERNHWNPILFSDAAGGGFAVVGIVWLVPIFGIYFARKLLHIGLAPARPGKTIGLYLAVAAFMIGCGALIFGVLKVQAPASFLTFAGASLVTAALAYSVWPALGKVLLLYGLGARIPVAAVAMVAILHDWQTHYDKAPPEVPQMGVWEKFVALGLIPQLTLWIAFTMVVGGVFGAVAVALSGKQARESAALQS